MKISNYTNNTRFKSGDLYFKVSREIYNLRKYFNLTQKDLADRIGTKQSGIARFEKGVQLPSLSTLKKIGDSVGVRLEPPKFLFFGENKTLQENSTQSYNLISAVKSPYITPSSTKTNDNIISYE